MTNWRESETRLVLAAVQRFRAFIPNICILVYATSPWKLLAPLSILQCTRTFSFVRAPTIISTQFSLALFSFLSFFLFSPMLHLNTENYILPDPRRTWNATVFVIASESLFLLNSPSKSSYFLTFVRRIDRGIVPPRLLFYITKCISSHRQVTFTHFPRVQYVFISSLALTSLVHEPLQSYLSLCYLLLYSASSWTSVFSLSLSFSKLTALTFPLPLSTSPFSSLIALPLCFSHLFFHFHTVVVGNYADGAI